MVAAEPVWHPLAEFRSLDYSVIELREMVAAMARPDPEFLARLARDPRVTVRRMAYRGLGMGKKNLARNEDIFREDGIVFIAGADEAGRGALAGPIVAAAVVFAPDVVIKGIADSKELTPGARDSYYARIIEKADGVAVSFIDHGLIDRWGLQAANLKALGDSLNAVADSCDCAVCDHFKLDGLRVRSYGIPKADATFQCVAAASIVAKVERDRVMRSLHNRFPQYNFYNNKGYATEEHLTALAVYGPCQFHRLSFNGVGPEDEELELWNED